MMSLQAASKLAVVLTIHPAKIAREPITMPTITPTAERKRNLQMSYMSQQDAADQMVIY